MTLSGSREEGKEVCNPEYRMAIWIYEEQIMGNVYGYVRVSTREQNEDRQMIAI